MRKLRRWIADLLIDLAHRISPEGRLHGKTAITLAASLGDPQ